MNFYFNCYKFLFKNCVVDNKVMVLLNKKEMDRKREF